MGTIALNQMQVRRPVCFRGNPTVRRPFRDTFGLSLMATALLLMTPPGRGQVATADDRGGLTPDTGEAQESSKTEDQSLEDFLRIYRFDPTRPEARAPAPAGGYPGLLEERESGPREQP